MVRHTRKSKSKRRDGFRGHVAAEPETGLITDCEMTMAAGPGSTDAENGVKMAARDRFHPPAASPGAQAPAQAGAPGQPEPRDAEPQHGAKPQDEEPQHAEPQHGAEPQDEEPQHGAEPQDAGPQDAEPQDAEPHDGAEPQGAEPHGAGLEVYGDPAYGSGEARAAYRDAGHDTVIKPGPLRSAVPGGFTIDDFAVSEHDGTVTCPAGQVRLMSPARTVTFGAACAARPLRDRCTTARDGRSMTIHRHEGLLRAARAQARTEEFSQAYPTRSSIERTIAWTATQNGRRVRLRYIGTAASDAWLHTRCAALNLRTLLKAGLARRDRAWVLA